MSEDLIAFISQITFFIIQFAAFKFLANYYEWNTSDTIIFLFCYYLRFAR
jgi:hypothetical protein